VSDNIEDVYIHTIDIKNLEKLIDNVLSKGLTWKIFKNMLEIQIYAIVGNLKGNIKIKGKTYKSVEDFFVNFIDINNNREWIEGFKKYKSNIESFFSKEKNKFSKIDKNGYTYEAVNVELKIKIFDYLSKFLK